MFELCADIWDSLAQGFRDRLDQVLGDGVQQQLMEIQRRKTNFRDFGLGWSDSKALPLCNVENGLMSESVT